MWSGFKGMRSFQGMRRLAVVGVALAGVLGTGAAGTATAAGEETAVFCPIGYMCLQPLFGSQPVLVRQGDRATFSPALRVTEVTNSTSVTYCVTGGLNYALPAGGTQTWDSTVNSVAPMPVPGACLA